MSLDLLRFQTERLVEKTGNLERLAAGYFSRVDEANEAALAKLREQEDALLALPPTPPARVLTGRSEPAPGTPTDERAQFAANRKLMQQGLRGGG